MNRKLAHHSSQRGAIIIQVAVFLLALTAFSAFVVDYGIMWTSRGQAQNAADAGALAAATHLMLNPTSLANGQLAAKKFAAINAVWNVETAARDVLFQSGLPCPPGTSGGTGCIRVDVLRGAIDRNNVQHTNYLPTIFANLVGKTQQGVIATAMAEITAGNAVKCVKPWIVADKWIDASTGAAGGSVPGAWDLLDTYTAPPDSYVAPGFTPQVDTGLQMPLKPGNIGTYNSGWAMEIDFGCMGGNCYRDNIESCPSWVPTVGIYDGTLSCNAQNDTTDPVRGCLSVRTGMSQGPTSQGVNTLIGQDRGAYWVAPGDAGYDPARDDPDNLGYVQSPCMSSNNCTNGGAPTALSPRIVPIAVFDTSAFVNETCSGTGCVARVVNLMGFFIEGMCNDVYPSAGSRPAFCGSPSQANKTVLGRLMRYPGQGVGTGAPTTSSFVQMVRLVR